MAKQPSPIATAIGQHQGSLNLPCPRYMQRHCFNDVRPGRDSQRLVSFMDFDHVIVELWVVYIVFTPVHFHSIHKWQEGLAILVSTYRSVWNHVKSPCFEVSAVSTTIFASGTMDTSAVPERKLHRLSYELPFSMFSFILWRDLAQLLYFTTLEICSWLGSPH